MKRLITILGISLLVTLVGLLLMDTIAIKAIHSSKPRCCDQFDLEASYGFPLPFKQIYSGGLSGAGEEITRPNNVVIDVVLVFATTFTVLGVASVIRKRSK